jgi:hypothetical protein
MGGDVMTAPYPKEEEGDVNTAESYPDLIKQLQDEHPEYAEHLALARKAAELQNLTDQLRARQLRTPIVTYSGTV